MTPAQRWNVQVLAGSASGFGSSSAHPGSSRPTWQGAHALHLDPLFARGDLHPLSEPFQIFDFDLAAPPVGDQQVALDGIHITRAGMVHAVALWWRADMDSTSSSCLHTAPRWVPPRGEPLTPLLCALAMQ